MTDSLALSTQDLKLPVGLLEIQGEAPVNLAERSQPKPAITIPMVNELPAMHL